MLLPGYCCVLRWIDLGQSILMHLVLLPELVPGCMALVVALGEASPYCRSMLLPIACTVPASINLTRLICQSACMQAPSVSLTDAVRQHDLCAGVRTEATCSQQGIVRIAHEHGYV